MFFYETTCTLFIFSEASSISSSVNVQCALNNVFDSLQPDDVDRDVLTLFWKKIVTFLQL